MTHMIVSCYIVSPFAFAVGVDWSGLHYPSGGYDWEICHCGMQAVFFPLHPRRNGMEIVYNALHETFTVALLLTNC